jgi:hypothetical protein
MKRWAILALSAALLGPAMPAEAQVNFGPQLAWGDDTDLGLGGRIDFGVADALGVDDGPFQNLFASTSITYFFCDWCDYFEINGNLAVPFTLEGSSIAPYAGAGIHIGRFSFDEPLIGDEFDDTEVGLNLLGGIFFPLSDLTGFAEGKFGLGGADQFVLSAGVLF